MLYIDKYAYYSRMVSVNPFEKIVFAIMTMTVCLASNSILIPFSVLVLMSGIAVLRGGIPLSIFLRLLLVPMSFLIIGVITVAVNVIHDTTDMLFGIAIYGTNIGVTADSLLAAAKLLFKALGAVSCLYFLSLTTPLIDIITALRKLKFPGILLEIMSLVYKFIFVLLETADRIYVSQASRLGYKSLKTGYHSLGQLISSLFIRSYKRSEDLYTALEARGYNGELRVLDQSYIVSVTNITFIIIIEILLITLAIMVGGRI